MRGGEPADRARYELLRCVRCGSAVTAGEPPGPDAHAAGMYAARPPRAARVVAALQRLAARLPRRMLATAAIEPGARVLDAGAGRGRLVEALRASGYAAEGIDASPRAPGVGRAAIEEHEDSGLDAVVLWHVLEHVTDPAGALAAVRRWLRPGGVLLVGVPNVASVQAAVGGDSWFHLDAPRHRTHFSAAGLCALLARAGFDVREERHLVPEHNLHGMWFALLGRLGMTPGFPFHLVKRNVPLRPRDVALLLLAGPLLALPALALELAAVALRRGGTVAVVARTT